MISNWILPVSLLVYSSLYIDGRQVHPLIIYDVGAKPVDNCTSEIYCHGDLLHTVQLLEIFEDSKDFVDMPMKRGSAEIIASFQQLMNETKMELSTQNLRNKTLVRQYGQVIKSFVCENFECHKKLLEPVDPSDWREEPKLIQTISSEKYKDWANGLNGIWRNLTRRMSQDVKDNADRHSLIYVDNPFVIPGGRFKEFYYWDSYWVIEGLLLCDMVDTARGMIENFLSMVEHYGFVPNGGRKYYLSRSQPPLLIPMVVEYFRITGDWSFVEDNLKTLEREFQYWMKYKSVTISKDGRNYTLSRYVTHSPGPRPESYREDYHLAEDLTDPQQRYELYNNLKAGAESGWDFSSRWFANENGTLSDGLKDIVASNILPVDLNAFIERNARTLFEYFYHKEDMSAAKYYEDIADNYRDGIKALMWNEEDGTWYDFDMKHEIQRKRFYLSNLTPLYTMSYEESMSHYYGERAVAYLRRNKMSRYTGGMPTSLDQSGQQWDFPNVWAPLQSIVVEGLKKTYYAPAVKLAEQLALEFLNATYEGKRKSQKMFEKYHAMDPGATGGGGEYKPQDGFGWTNGVVLQFLNLFFTEENNPLGVKRNELDKASTAQEMVFTVKDESRGHEQTEVDVVLLIHNTTFQSAGDPLTGKFTSAFIVNPVSNFEGRLLQQPYEYQPHCSP